MVWGCFAGDTLGDLFKIQGKLTSLVCGQWDCHYCFPQEDYPTSRLYKGNLTNRKSEGVLRQMISTIT